MDERKRSDSRRGNYPRLDRGRNVRGAKTGRKYGRGSHLAVLGEETEVEREVEVGHRLVEEARVPGLVAGHQGEDLSRDGGGLLEPAAELLVEEETGELRGA